ncbi:Malate dehydrogenase 2 [Durusdinium trenchii]|uniref:Mitochondrial n=1 Tax=Durusdinium trenchii TaxID=1381693 RepID=A0ABP0MWX3_9DINO
MGYHFAHTVLDSRDFLLPQRRNRVWGLASVMSGSFHGQNAGEEFTECLKSMHSNFRFPSAELWQQGLPTDKLKTAREERLVQMAKEAFPGSTDLFVDCASSLNRPTHAAYAVPCITPTHPIYSVELERYLTARDLLMAQGFWPTCFSPTSYQFLLDNPDLAQDLAGNAFSSTVFQAVFMSALATCPQAWETVHTASGTEHAGGKADAPLRRVRGKRSAPEFGEPHAGFTLQTSAKPKACPKKSQQAKAKKKRRYARKKPHIDSRKFSKGKRKEATLWEKEQLMAAYDKAKNDPSCKNPAKSVERIQLGEEVTYALVKNTLVLAIEQWNHTVQKAREELKDPKLLLKELNDSFDPNVSEAGKEFQEKDLEVVYERLCQSLPEVKVKELSKYLHIGPLQSRTHIWSSETMLSFLDHMAGELRARRQELNLDLSHRALLICDMASQHSAKKFKTSALVALRSDAYAVESLRSFECGKLVWLAWMSRGFVSVQNIADWRFQGDEQKVKDLMKRAKNSMQSLLDLNKLPDLNPGAKELADLEALRSTPLQNEVQLHWAVQDQEDVETRQALPRWVAQPIERKVSRWVDEHEAWMQKIEDRAQLGKNLAPSQQKSFEKWNQENGTCNFLFSKKKQAQIHHIRTNADVTKMAADLFSVQVVLSIDPQELLLKGSNGDAKRLVLLKGSPHQDDCIPGFLDQKPSESALQEALRFHEEDPDEDLEEADIDGQADEEEALLAADECLAEVLADSSEEETVQELIPTGYSRVKTFMHRDAYKRLAERGARTSVDSTGSVRIHRSVLGEVGEMLLVTTCPFVLNLYFSSYI